jgi:hypothetical protein
VQWPLAQLGICSQSEEDSNPGAKQIQHRDLKVAMVQDGSLPQCIAVQMLLTAVTPQVEDAAAATTGAAASSSSSSSSAVPAEWQLTASLEGQAVHAPSFDKMLELLGCSHRAVLWVATHEQHIFIEQAFAESERAYTSCVVPVEGDTHGAGFLLLAAPLEIAFAPPAALQRLQQQHQLHAQLHALFVHAAAQQSSRAEYGRCLVYACSASFKARHHCRCISGAVHAMQVTARKMSSPSLGQPHLLIEPQLPAAVVDEVQQLQPQLLSDLLGLRRSKLSAAPAATAAAGSSSGGSSGNSSSSEDDKEHLVDLELTMNLVGSSILEHAGKVVLPNWAPALVRVTAVIRPPPLLLLLLVGIAAAAQQQRRCAAAAAELLLPQQRSTVQRSVASLRALHACWFS